MKSTLKKKWGRIALCLCMANLACVGMAQTNKKLDDQVINTMKTATQFMELFAGYVPFMGRNGSQEDNGLDSAAGNSFCGSSVA